MEGLHVQIFQPELAGGLWLFSQPHIIEAV
jgi:hypothetical protein